MDHVFISYARADTAFVRKLNAALETAGHETWVDWDGIEPSAKWMATIEGAIDAAEAVIFVISPESCASKVCGQELDHAIQRNKRLIPVLMREPPGEIRPEIAEINWIYAREADPFDEAVGKLVTAIETDLAWVGDHTRLTIRAVEWDENGRDASFTLRGSDLAAFEEWLAKAPDREPKPTGLQSEYLLASRRAVTRRQRIMWMSITAGLVVAVALGAIAWLQNEERQREAAERARQEEIAGARQLLSQAEALRETQKDPQDIHLDRRKSLRSATRALDRLARLGAPTTDSDRAVRRSLAALPKWREFEVPNPWDVQAPAFSQDRRRVVFHSKFGELQIWDTIDVERLAVCKTGISAGESVGAIAIAENGRIITQIYDSQPGEVTHRLQRWSMDDCRVLGEVGVTYEESKSMRQLTVSPDGRVLVRLGAGLHVWDAPGRPLRPLAQGVRTLDFSLDPEGTRVAGYERQKGSKDRWLRIRDIETGEVTAEALMPGRFGIIDWTAEGLRIQMDKRHYRYSEDLRNLGEIDPAFAHGIESADGRFYAELGSNGVVTVYRSGSDEKIAHADRRADFKGAAFRPDNRSLFLVSTYGVELGVWHFAASNAYAHIPVAGQPRWIGFSPDGAKLLARNEAGEAAWRLPELGKWAAPMAEASTLDANAQPIRPLLRPPVTAEDPDAEVILAEETLADGLRAVLVGGKFLRGGQSRRLEIWKDGTKRAERDVHPVLDDDRTRLLILAQNGAFVFTGARDGLNMFDTATLRTTAEIFHAGAIHAGARADGAVAVTVDRRNEARIWDIAQNLEVTRFTLPHAPVALELSPNGRWLAVLEPDRDIELWAIEPADLITQACTWLEAPCP